MTEHHKTYDVIVAGGGHNGLVAASYLAKAGKSVPASLEGSQLKINMLVSRLPRLKSGVDPRPAFSPTASRQEYGVFFVGMSQTSPATSAVGETEIEWLVRRPR